MQKKLSITKNVSGDEQESSFMNACLSNMGTLSVSIAIRPPRMEQGNQDSIAAKLVEDLKPLTDLGYEVEIQIGNDEEGEVNTNCLSGLHCPKCLSLEPLLIETTGLDPEGKEMMSSSSLLSCDEEPIKYIAKWYDEGSDETVGGTEWSEDSTCECCNCGREGTIRDFTLENSTTSLEV
ncbi:hypothetical protein VCHA53O466_50003 [Vibrio chagasii]|nr:hypothetical protein VCHA53O466_50003 [Vibrio chagasii]